MRLLARGLTLWENRAWHAGVSLFAGPFKPKTAAFQQEGLVELLSSAVLEPEMHSNLLVQAH